MKIQVVNASEVPGLSNLFLSIDQITKTTIYLEHDSVFAEEIAFIRKKYDITDEWLNKHLFDPKYEALYQCWEDY